MIINLSPAGINLPFEVLKAGDVLTLNGVRVDMSRLPDGATLPLEALPEPHFAGDARRVDGELHVVLRLPYPPSAGEAVRWPEPILKPADGRVALPTDGLPGGAMPKAWPHAEASIDWTRIITREDKEQAAAAEHLAHVVSETAALRAAADSAIAPLQDAMDIDDATDAELLALKAWKKYRVTLNRLPEQPGYPTAIDWPVPPA